MSVFVWTKIGSEAGESIADIIARKGDEQTAGEDTTLSLVTRRIKSRSVGRINFSIRETAEHLSNGFRSKPRESAACDANTIVRK